jgi:hypothetical protein
MKLSTEQRVKVEETLKDFLCLVPRYLEVKDNVKLYDMFLSRNRNPLFDMTGTKFWETGLESNGAKFLKGKKVKDHYIPRKIAMGFIMDELVKNPSISLDDFGTGYSSLAYLTSYPFDILKIDRAFISKIGQEKDEAIVNAIIAMGNAIGITLVAEGVETKEQALFLQKHGCYILQGFYFSKALSSADSTKYLEQHKLIKIC